MIRQLKVRVVFGVLLAAFVSAAGLLLRAEPPQAVGTWASLGTTPESRVGAAAVALPDGRTLIAGGSIAGAATDSVVVFDPADGSFASAGHLLLPRVGHTATLLDDGRVLIAGGTAGDLLSADLELFDPSSGTSVLGGAMAQPRTGHAAARLADGKVLIAGGTSTDGVLQTAEIYDPTTGNTTATTLPMLTPRTGASATTLIDGRVLIAGGNNGTADLASAELFEASSQIFEAATTSLSVPRSRHAAVLLPWNNSVLIAGGSSNGVAQTTSDLFLPAEFPDPYSYGMGSFAPTGSLVTARSGAVASPHIEGYAVAIGGGAPEAEVYRFATIKTDKDDYAPGTKAIITGSGWEPNADVTLVFQEDPAVHDDYILHVTSKSDGTIYWDQWAPEKHDLNVRFYLMAKQATPQGERRAQTTFTDAELVTTELTAPINDVTVTQGSSTSFTISTSATGGIKCVATSSSPATATIRTVYSISAGGTLSSSTPSAALNFFGGAPIGGPNCNVTWTGAPAAYSVGASVSAAATTPIGDYTINLSTSAGTVAVTNPMGSGGSLADDTATAITVHVVAPANTAPTATVALNTATPGTNATLTATATRADVDGDTVTLTYVWKVNGVTQQTTGGSASLTDTFDLSVAGHGNTGDVITVEVTPNDGTVDGTLVSATATVQNTAPTATVALNTATPGTNDTLTATATKADVDGDTVTLTYVWKVNGVTQQTTGGSASLTDTFDLSVAGHGNTGDVITVEVTPNDGTVDGTLVSATATVQNTAPTATVALNTATPGTNDTLTATATKADVDGDTVTLTYVWKVNGVTQQTTGGSASLTDTFDLSVAGHGNTGDVITVEVTPNDGTVDGTLVSATATVQNTAPTATVALNTATPGTNDTLTATATKADVDGDTVTLTYVWKVNGVTQQTTGGSASLTDTFDLSVAGHGNTGDVITVEVTPNDGTVDGTLVSATATVQNTAPTATVALNTATPGTNDTLTATATKADVDGDTVTLTYVWKVNGVTQQTTGGSASLTDTFDLSVAGHGNTGDVITVEVTPNDGTVDGTLVSATATVQNTAPTATVALNTATPGTNDTLTATATKADVDGDTVTLTYVWKVNGVTQQTTGGSASLTDTFDLSVAGHGNAGDVITVEVTPNDGTVGGTLVSATATVQNTAPTATAVNITGTPNVGQVLTGHYTYSDVDLDAEGVSTFRWLRDGVAIVGATSSTYTVIADDLTHAIRFEVTPVAATGASPGVAVTSAGVNIVFDFVGFFRPVENASTNSLNRVKAGSSVPIKFSLHGNFGLNIFAYGYPRIVAINCTGVIETIPDTELSTSTANNGLVYDATADQYNYVWKTTNNLSNTCRQFQIRLIDGTEQIANFQFTK